MIYYNIRIYRLTKEDISNGKRNRKGKKIHKEKYKCKR